LRRFFDSGVGDESLGFEIIGVSFCNTVESYFDIIAIANEDVEGTGRRFFSSIVKIYRCWAPRLEKNKLSMAKEHLEKKIGSIQQSSVKPFGTE
jgi:hypothetical protein